MNSMRRTWLAAQRIIMVALLSSLSNSLWAQEEWVPEMGSSSSRNPATSGQRIVEFAGRQWAVKSGCGLGPGPNCWSDSEQSVWVEGGQLHLKIREIDGTWYSAEVYTTDCTQYGMHRFFTASRLDNLDKNVVAALFLYKDDATEIDVEFAKWGVGNPISNAQY